MTDVLALAKSLQQRYDRIKMRQWKLFTPRAWSQTPTQLPSRVHRHRQRSPHRPAHLQRPPHTPMGKRPHQGEPMSNITDLEKRINSAEATLEYLKAELEELKQQEPEPEKEDLFGRWATHKEYGRGIIVSIKPDGEGEVRFAYRTSRYTDGVDTRFVRLESLDLDPLTLTTLEDYRNAPFGTIIEFPDGDVYVGDGIEWHGYSGEYGSKAMVSIGTCRVIRWGNGQ